MKFLMSYPRYSLPYQFRGVRNKVASRVKASETRKRLEDGRFEPKTGTTQDQVFPADIESNCPA